MHTVFRGVQLHGMSCSLAHFDSGLHPEAGFRLGGRPGGGGGVGFGGKGLSQGLCVGNVDGYGVSSSEQPSCEVEVFAVDKACYGNKVDDLGHDGLDGVKKGVVHPSPQQARHTLSRQLSSM